MLFIGERAADGGSRGEPRGGVHPKPENGAHPPCTPFQGVRGVRPVLGEHRGGQGVHPPGSDMVSRVTWFHMARVLVPEGGRRGRVVSHTLASLYATSAGTRTQCDAVAVPSVLQLLVHLCFYEYYPDRYPYY